MLRSFRFWFTTVVFTLTAVILIGFVSSSDRYFYIKKNFTILSEVYEEVSESYVEEVDPERLMRNGINAMLETLDPYTVLVDEAESQRMDEMTTGQYAGVGLEVGARDGKLVVIAPIEGYSAHRKGIRAGDIIVEVDGISTDGMSSDDLQGLLRGEPDSEVELKVERYGMDQEIEFELTRETIEITNVSYSGLLEHDGDEKIAYVVLNRFAQNAAEEVRDEINELKDDGDLDGIMLDLRNNPGGLLTEAVNMVDLFVEPGIEIVSTQGRESDQNDSYESSQAPAFEDEPLIVLQNSGSASASEIVSGAIQDLDRGIVAGERSFGKGLVQIVRPLSYNMALKITTSKYYIPSGRSIQSLDFAGEEDSEEADIDDEDRTPFETKGGRTVYESIGIEPDVEAEEREESMVELSLLQESKYFFFANQFYSDNDDYSELTDEIFQDFKAFLDDEEFTFQTRGQEYYDEFVSNLDDPMKEQASAELAALNEVITEEQETQFDMHEDEIRASLHEELISRYDGEDGRMKAAIRTDNVINEALEYLTELTLYQNFLEAE